MSPESNRNNFETVQPSFAHHLTRQTKRLTPPKRSP